MKSYIPFLSLRYLWFHKVSSGLGILGVALGVGLVIVVVGVMDGFQTRLKESLIANTTPVVVRPYYDVDADLLVGELRRRIPGVVEASPVVYATTLVAQEGRRHTEGTVCRVVGIDAARENRVSDLARKLRRGTLHDGPLALLESASPENPFRTPDEDRARDVRIRPEKQGVLLGRTLQARLGLMLGDRVGIYTLRSKSESGRGGSSGVELAAEREFFRVTGSFSVDDTELDNILLMDRLDAISYFKEGMRQECDEVRLLLADSERADEVKEAVAAQCDAIVAATLKKGGRTGPGRPLEALTWKDVHRPLLNAVANERGLLLIITSFSFIVVAFLIGSTQSMLVVEKTREIGVLRSLGASVAGTSGVFIGNGFFIGAIGAGAGWALGMGITSHVQEIADFLGRAFGINVFPADIYRFSRIPIDVKPDFVLSICIGAVVFALLGAILPAVRAAMLDPVESLHHE